MERGPLSQHAPGPISALGAFWRGREGGSVRRVGARPIEVPVVNAALLAGPESQIITSISDNGRVINTGLVSPTAPGLRRLIQADGRALKGVMDNSLNSPNAAQPGPPLPPNLKQSTHPALKQYQFTCSLKTWFFTPDFPVETYLPPALHPDTFPKLGNR